MRIHQWSLRCLAAWGHGVEKPQPAAAREEWSGPWFGQHERLGAEKPGVVGAVDAVNQGHFPDRAAALKFVRRRHDGQQIRSFDDESVIAGLIETLGRMHQDAAAHRRRPVPVFQALRLGIGIGMDDQPCPGLLNRQCTLDCQSLPRRY